MQYYTNGGSDVAVKSNGWQQVTDKRKKKQEKKETKKVENASHPAKQSSIFAALEEESKRRSEGIQAQKAAAIAPVQSGDEGSEEGDLNDVEVAKPSGEGVNGLAVKPKKVKAKKPKVSIADAAKVIDVEHLSAFLSDISTNFADSPEIQLMRCGDYFARAFSLVTPAQIAWNKFLRDSALPKAIEVPLNDVPEPVIAVTSKWLASKPLAKLSAFALMLLKSVLEDVQASLSQKNSSKTGGPQVGVLVVLALLLRRKPEVLLQQAEQLQKDPFFQGLEKLPTLLWAFGQVALGDLAAGMSLWVRNCVPLIAGKQANPATRDVSLQFIEGVLFANLKKARASLLSSPVRAGDRIVPVESLMTIMRAAYQPDALITKATPRIAAIYPFLRELCLAGTFRGKPLRTIAQELLPLSLAAASEEPEARSNEASSLMVWCLSQGGGTYAQWDKLHMANLGASTRVLKFMLRDWAHCHGRLVPYDDLRQTIGSFRRKLKVALKGAAKGDSQLEGQLRTADSACAVIQGKMSSLPSCFKATVTLAVAAGIGYGLFLLGPSQNPWGWNGKILLDGGIWNP
eukprot:TRINITY_DN21698_c0_g1_i1.p1 TRINITY_DN21698_c0_g1~~TRINITY_DN21698_c0_g1_i1.p1  ORF type:complete len:571 (+),score=102.26 TRINITY_DN21698_c0_g1_i1:219-1931(+)